MVFDEVLENVVGLMMDPFGNYLIQKLLDRCSEQQRLEVRVWARSIPAFHTSVACHDHCWVFVHWLV